MSIEPDKAFTLILEPVKSCNLQCLYCYSDIVSGGMMNRQTLRTAIEKAARYSEHHGFSEMQVLWHGGEPLLAGLPFFRAATEILQGLPSSLSFQQFIQTNGLALDDDFCAFFRDHGFQIGLSFDGPQDLHDAMRIYADGQGTYSLVRDRLDLLEKHDLSVGFNAVVTRLSLGQEERIYRFFQELGYGFRVNPVIPGATGATTASWLLRRGEYGSFLCALFDQWVGTELRRVRVSPLDRYLEAVLNGVLRECHQRQTCVGLQVGVTPSGDTVLCTRNESHVLGNILDMEIEEMLTSDFCENISRRGAVLSSCQTCPYFSICNGGCSHNALVFSQNYMGRDPFCKDYLLIFEKIRESLEDLQGE